MLVYEVQRRHPFPIANARVEQREAMGLKAARVPQILERAQIQDLRVVKSFRTEAEGWRKGSIIEGNWQRGW